MAGDAERMMPLAHFRCWTRPAGTEEWWGEFDFPGNVSYPGVFGLPLSIVRMYRPDWVPANGLPVPDAAKLATERGKMAGYAEASKIEDAAERAARMWAIFRESVLPMLGFVFPPFAGITVLTAAANSLGAFAGPDNETRKLFVDAAVGAVKAGDQALLAGGKKAAEVVIAGAGGMGVVLLVGIAVAFFVLRKRAGI